MMHFDLINDTTGFANGDEFKTESEVYAYFTVEAQREMGLGYDAEIDQETLDLYAQTVLDNHWHCRF